MTKKKLSRTKLTLGALTVIIILLVIAFKPQPILVDIGTVSQGQMQVTINEEASTQVTDLYVLSAPISGRLLRVSLNPGDNVIKDKTVVAHMLSSPLGGKNTTQGQAKMQAAEASVLAAKATLVQARADKNLAQQQANRREKQFKLGTLSAIDNENAQQNSINMNTALITAKALLEIRQAELAVLTSELIDNHNENIENDMMELIAPISGKILGVVEESEKVLVAGAPILEIGDVNNGLEVIVELLSSDAVQINAGQKVLVTNWGGEETLQGVVSRIEPLGFIKTSALGVEERRVKAIVALNKLQNTAVNLGHGYRVDVAIVVWEKSNTIKVPSSALFRENKQWAVFVVNHSKAQLRTVTVEKNNGTEASILQGLQVDERVILYPASDLVNGAAVAQR
ncbi:RND transporter [Pseudoalteromonas sp. S201]|uniref:efflux RND transporter periplasmic adaptor subunit n=1 Tax=Pseudoalteromonas sp. S201 TaxID=579519 RepID=UPI00110CD053|nr:HlyD family efflux transporter periplasmic adaptor subunit [Pseudoalteromonas sp. S201]TMS90942.1 RND transporter [Pseudoalteromonas sp. S201]|tara:strand:+ start:418 stop:1611 length:1194 start_codon:yes stop_codon:yes gene_type:complete